MVLILLSMTTTMNITIIYKEQISKATMKVKSRVSRDIWRKWCETKANWKWKRTSSPSPFSAISNRTLRSS
jgi:hypothetical protein